MNSFSISQAAPPNWGTVVATASDASGGTISSLRWANITALGGISKEYIDSHDHGRYLQSSWSDSATNSEQYNPTEGGCVIDGSGTASSSKLLMASVIAPNILQTRTQLAFWNDVDGLRVSPLLLDKVVTLGYQGLWNAIKISETLTLPKTQAFSLSQWEQLTAYLPSEFSIFETYSKSSGAASPLSDGPGEQSAPVLFSTPDAAWGLAIYSPVGTPGGGYGRWRFGDCVKMNAVTRLTNPTPGQQLQRDTYITIGNRADALSSMRALT